MKSDPLDQFINLRKALLEEKAGHLARLAQIDKALGTDTVAVQPLKETRIPVSAPVSGVEKPKRKMSKAARAKIAAAQKARWAKAKLANQPKTVEAAPAPASAALPAPVASTAEKPKTRMKKAARAKTVSAQKARSAKVKASAQSE